MATKIVTKNSSTASAVPTASDLVQGELAVNVADKRLFTEDNGGSIVELGTNPSSLTVSGNIDVDGTTNLDATNIVGALDVTGTATMDGLTVESATGAEVTLKNTDSDGASGEYVGKLHFEGSDSSSGASGVRAGIYAQYGSSFGYTSLDLLTSISGGSLKKGMTISGDGDISFYEDTGTTAKFFWDASAESLGIGTSSPNSYTNFTTLTIDGTTGSEIDLEAGATKRGALYATATEVGLQTSSATNLPLTFGTNGTERMRIDSSGNVGIGNNASSPTSLLELRDSANIQFQMNKHGVAGFDIINEGTSGTELGTVDPYPLIVKTNNSERLRIDASGNLLVGTTDTTIYNDNTDEYGFMVEPSGQMQLSANNATMLYLNRQNGDGSIVDFRKDGSTVGSIGTVAGRLGIGTGDAGLFFDDDNNKISPVTMVSGTPVDSDGLLDLGYSAARYKDLYLSGGVRNVNGDGFNAGTEGGEPILIPADTSGALNGQGSLGHPSFRWKDAYLSGGVYLGGTGAANKLDDYEEGTWTPAFVNFSGTSGRGFVNAKYTKIGNLVYLSCDISGGSATLSSTQNSSRLSGMPFSVNGTYSPCSFSTNYITDEGTGVLYGNVVYTPSFSITNEKVIYFSGVYQTS